MKKILCKLMIISIVMMFMSGGAVADEFQKIKLRFANAVPANFPTSKADIFIAEELEKRTNGAVTVKMFHGGTLGSPKEMIDLIGDGAIDMGNFPSTYVFSRLPMTQFFSIPTVYPNLAINGALMRAGFESSKKMAEDFKKNNLYPFNFRALPVYNIISKKPITKMEDFKGLKIRTFGTVAPKMFKAVGAIPVNIQFHEVYEGLQRGTVDAAFTSTAAGYAYKLQEVAKYIIDLPLGADPCYQSFVNLDVYNSWPQNLKDLFNQIVKEAEALSNKVHSGFGQYATAEMLKAGVKMHHFEDADKFYNAIPDPIQITYESVINQGKSYKAPAKKYADWLRAEIAKLK
jgi:TRAP-type transport system periplasmic protein